MTKQELEKAIENGESVWFADYDNKVKEVILEKTAYIKENYVYLTTNGKYQARLKFIIDRVCKTKAEAEHYLHHANITRTEHLPFLTWEEFKKKKHFGFYSINNEWINLYLTNGLESDKQIITIENATKEEFLANYDLTEANFYKAYDECVRLFRGNYE